MTIAIDRQSQLEHRIPPPAVFLAVAVGMAGAAWFLPPSGSAGPATQVLAAVLFVLAGFIGPPAILSFRRNATTIDPVNIDRASTLVTTGIYRWTRNPMYLSMATLLTSLAAFSRPCARLWPCSSCGSSRASDRAKTRHADPFAPPITIAPGRAAL